MLEPLVKEFYIRDVLDVTKELLGKTLVRKIDDQLYRYKIVETEAYRGPEDKGSHAYNNKYTNRTKPLFEEGGITYIYFIYGMYNCLNIVVNGIKIPQAVLIRAVEPLDEASIVFAKSNRPIQSKKVRDLTNGPGKLCKALNIDRTLNGISVMKTEVLWIAEGEQPKEIVACPRINIPYAMEYEKVPWRFYIKDNPFVSILHKEEKS